MTSLKVESENAQNPTLSADFVENFSPDEALTDGTLLIVDHEAVEAEVLAEIEAKEAREQDEILESVERDIAEQERLDANALHLKKLKQTALNAKTAQQQKRALARKRVATEKQEKIAAWRRGEGREQYNAEGRNYYRIMIDITEGRTVRPSTSLKDMTAEEKAAHKREQATDRKRKQRASAANDADK
ncbi:MAG: hypothetical protein ACJAQU_000316 [Loktanella salsilacus]|jgi:hypothetical protein